VKLNALWNVTRELFAYPFCYEHLVKLGAVTPVLAGEPQSRWALGVAGSTPTTREVTSKLAECAPWTLNRGHLPQLIQPFENA